MTNTADPMLSPVALGRAPTFAPWPYYSTQEIAAVNEVLRSGKVNYWTGDQGRAFEREYAAHCGVRYAIALANGSVALQAALHGLGIGAGDQVVVTPRSFVASASCVLLAGARPVFADVDPDSQNITAASVRAVLSDRTRAVIAVHLAGWPCDMDAITALAQERGLKLIEDCAQAHGASYRGRPVGSFGDAAAFSFCQDKIITTGGEGGMLVCDDERLWRAAWSYKDHGKDYDAVQADPDSPGYAFRWVHESAGTNWRMTEMQAAIGRRQLVELPGWVAARRRHAALLAERLGRLPELRVPLPKPEFGHAYYKFYAFVRPQRLRSGWSRDRLLAEINAAGVPCFSGSCSEIYREKAFAACRPERPLPVARELGQNSLMFLVHPTLTERQLDYVCATVERECARAGRR